MRKEIFRKYYLNLASKFSSIKKGVHILNGHFIAEGNESKDIFYDLIRKLNSEADLINIQEAVSLIYSKTNLTKGKYVAFTFDDGFEECYTKIKPVFDEFKIKAAFFINPNFIDGNETYKKNFLQNIVFLNGHKEPMTWGQIQELHDENHIIGAHTMDHKRLVNLSDEELKYQIIDCKRYLESKLLYSCDYFAYTYGKQIDIDTKAKLVCKKTFLYNFTQSNHRNYTSFEEEFINRRHFEGNWPFDHVKYFLQSKK